ncbi:alpha/beta fold hydrolase [Nonomuraea sp. NPDC049269]|uniref:alpha/beta fold hydrolase n=1 Tax=Nonomuraea sp. NPDC049269 TaxID=3364349 RepID=UPI00371D7E45
MYVETPVARFHYTKTGSGSPVVLIAGGAQWQYSYRDTIPVLAREHTVYAVDMPSQGYTTGKDDFAYDLPAMSDALGSGWPRNPPHRRRCSPFPSSVSWPSS